MGILNVFTKAKRSTASRSPVNEKLFGRNDLPNYYHFPNTELISEFIRRRLPEDDFRGYNLYFIKNHTKDKKLNGVLKFLEIFAQQLIISHCHVKSILIIKI